MPNIVVIGAGVSGLTSAYLLSQHKENKVTVIAKHMPGDYDIEYASPWAGANVLPMATAENSRWERRTWPELKRLADEVPEAGIHSLKARVYRREKDLEKLREGEGASFDSLFAEDPWFASLFSDFRELGRQELPAGAASGCEFGSVCINTALYLPWLVGQCRANGVTLRRGQVRHVAEAAALFGGGVGSDGHQRADVVVNTTGLMASRLGGVMDDKLYPARGQIVVVRNEAPYMATVSGTDDAADEVSYVMTRASGGGTILGGTYAPGNWESQPDPNIAMRIMRRAVELVPELVGGRGGRDGDAGEGVRGLDVVRHGVGLRPARDGGVRIESERIADVWVVHNYGHSGWGYQGSYGCAERVVELVDEVLGRPKL